MPSNKKRKKRNRQKAKEKERKKVIQVKMPNKQYL